MIKLPVVWREAFEELMRRKLRTLLTLLGLIFGVGSIVAMQAVGEGSRREALRLVEGLGLNNIVVESREQDEETLREHRARSLGLSLTDARVAFALTPGAKRFAAEKTVKVHSVFSHFAASDIEVSGVSPDYFSLSALTFAEGRGFSDADDKALAAHAVLGDQAARSLFPDGNALGQTIKVNHVWLEVVGVLIDRDLSKDQFEGVALGLETNRIFIPLSSAKARFRFQAMEPEIDRFQLQVSKPEEVSGGARVVSAVLDQRHAGIEDSSLLVPAQLFKQHQKTQQIFSVVMASIAAVSLLVGGIGIMNIMLANVLERRREIGLLRALGARRRDVIAQFVRETSVICAVGALMGLVFGMALAYLIATFAGWEVAWAPIPILFSTLACALIGLCFGIYPARQAADLDPIAALRTE
jgi:putative ABC transport system permease protein